jgi:MraZ protein
MLSGQHNCLMDEKGRVALPAALHAGLGVGDGNDGAVFILTGSLFDPCLIAQTEAAFEAQATKMRTLAPSHPAAVAYMRYVVGSAHTLSVDRAGRVNIPRELREQAALERDVVWVGAFDKVELWSRTRFDEARKKLSVDDLAAIRAFMTSHDL